MDQKPKQTEADDLTIDWRFYADTAIRLILVVAWFAVCMASWAVMG